MKIAEVHHTTRQAPYEGYELAQLDAARVLLNDAVGCLRDDDYLGRTGNVATILQELDRAHAAVAGVLRYDGPARARAAAVMVLPTIDRAQRGLLGQRAITAAALTPAAAEIDRALDRIERVLGAAGYE